jgi:hypothetical protein
MNIVTLPYDSEWTAQVWAKENCPSYITSTVKLAETLNDGTKIVYFFSKESDAILFTLMWA